MAAIQDKNCGKNPSSIKFIVPIINAITTEAINEGDTFFSILVKEILTNKYSMTLFIKIDVSRTKARISQRNSKL